MFREISENLLIPRRKILVSNSARQNLWVKFRQGLHMAQLKTVR